MLKVKICGLSRIEDVEWANELLPEYVGFVFAHSKRRVLPERAAMIAARLDPGIKRVGVFVNAKVHEIQEVLAVCPLDILQLHGDESPDFCSSLRKPLWKAFRIATADNFAEVEKYQDVISAALLDSFHLEGYGGMGQAFVWEWANGLQRSIPIILAGGLDCSNIKKAVETVKPFAVDVSSAMETDGFKDAAKISEFIKKVRSLYE